MMTKREKEDKRDGRNGNCLRNSCRGAGTDEEKAFFPHSRRLRRVQLPYATHHICSVFGIFLPPSFLSLSPACPRWVTGGTRSKEQATRPTGWPVTLTIAAQHCRLTKKYSPKIQHNIALFTVSQVTNLLTHHLVNSTS